MRASDGRCELTVYFVDLENLDQTFYDGFLILILVLAEFICYGNATLHSTILMSVFIVIFFNCNHSNKYFFLLTFPVSVNFMF